MAAEIALGDLGEHTMYIRWSFVKAALHQGMGSTNSLGMAGVGL